LDKTSAYEVEGDMKTGQNKITLIRARPSLGSLLMMRQFKWLRALPCQKPSINKRDV
jgi:hypothetical protein